MTERQHTGSVSRQGTGRASQRVTVIGPRRGATTHVPRYAVTRDIDEQTKLGEVYIRSLIRAQLRLAALAGATFGTLLGGLPLLFALVPRVREIAVFGLPLPWLLLGILVYPFLVGGGWFYVRHAERNEREFARLVERS